MIYLCGLLAGGQVLSAWCRDMLGKALCIKTHHNRRLGDNVRLMRLIVIPVQTREREAINKTVGPLGPHDDTKQYQHHGELYLPPKCVFCDKIESNITSEQAAGDNDNEMCSNYSEIQCGRFCKYFLAELVPINRVSSTPHTIDLGRPPDEVYKQYLSKLLTVTVSPSSYSPSACDKKDQYNCQVISSPLLKINSINRSRSLKSGKWEW